jgi:hypothetical protein
MEAATCLCARKGQKWSVAAVGEEAGRQPTDVHCSSLIGHLHLRFFLDSKQQLDELQKQKLFILMLSSTLL